MPYLWNSKYIRNINGTKNIKDNIN